MLKELFGNMFNMDSTVMRSIRPLFLEPGALTRHFMEGRRASYVRPVRLYLISSLFFFVAFSTVLPALTGPSGKDLNISVDGEKVKKKTKASKAKQEQSDDSSGASAEKDDEAEADEPPPPMRGLPHSREELAKRFEYQGEKIAKMENAERLKVLLPHLVDAGSKGLFLLMPLFALFLKLLYVRRDPFYLDHLIFALHYHAFLLCFLAGLMWWNYFEDASLVVETNLAICLIPPWYLYRAMRNVYGQSRLKTMVKFFILNTVYVFAMVLLMGLASAIALLMI